MTPEELKAEIECRLEMVARPRWKTAPPRVDANHRFGRMPTFERLYRRLGLGG